MAHVDTAKPTPAMIDEVINRFSYSSEDPIALLPVLIATAES